MNRSIPDRPTPGIRTLEALNFFMADMQAGIGPFVGVFLLAHGWQSGLIGTVMTLGGVAGMVAITPVGALIDATRRKRAYVIFPGICTVLASGIVLLSQAFWTVTVSQIATAIAGAAIVPAVTGITLGMVHQRGFNRQNGRNQAFNHAGNMVGAGLSGYLGWQFGFVAVFALAAIFGIISIACVMMIPKDAIDDDVARGISESDETHKQISGFAVLFASKPLLVLAAALALFHLGNAAMLPFYGLAVVDLQKADPASFVAITIVIAQSVMIVMSIIAMRMAERTGFWLVLLISFLALPVRGLIAAHMISKWGVIPVQVLDGVGAGLQSVAVPGLVARILDGTGRVNLGQGAVMTVQGIGAALSPVLGGWIAQSFGYSAAFMSLGALAVASTVIWVVFADLVKRAHIQPSIVGASRRRPA